MREEEHVQGIPISFDHVLDVDTHGTVMSRDSRLETFAHQVISAINAGGHVGNFNMARIKHKVCVREWVCVCPCACMFMHVRGHT